ncbi:glutathione ABC transporter substrate-binding protein [Bordetella sp. LUAb4]|uniref:glutathione ABC transporter substrate-binding protein n=1 Tax=Bordetella sp. LUAb4 TaxID=2843195 RepID=UPI001E49947F|nr:glutathione ABC transporter substrate-binding protein [Bordetella sp. LUAb4]
MLRALRPFVLGATLALTLAYALPAHSAKDLTVGVSDNILGLDPTDLNDSVSLSATRLFYQGLFGFDENYKVIPVLAESYDVTDGATVYTVHLRKNVLFHDGTPFNAAAVKINYDRLRDPTLRLKRQSLLEAVDRVEVVDDATVRIVTKYPSAVLPNYLAHTGASIISPKALEQYGKDIGRHAVGTGPFVFVDKQADRLKARRNTQYWKPGLPKLDNVTIRSTPENGSRIAMLRAGEAQFIFPLPPEAAELVAKDPKLTTVKTPSIVIHYAALNTLKKPFDDLRVRQALNYVIDKDAFIRIVYNGYATPMDAPVAPGIAYYSKQNVWPYDPAKAKQLLAEAGYPNGFESEIWTFSNTLNSRAVQFLQQQLAAVGVRLAVKPIEAGVATDKLWGAKTPEEAQVRMFYGSWAPSTGDADWALRPLLSVKSYPPAMFNISYFHNEAVERALTQGLSTADPAVRKQSYDEVQKTVWDNAPWIFLSVDTLLAGRSKNLVGLRQQADTSLSYETADLQ